MIVNHISQGRPGGGAGGWSGRGWWDQCDARERGKRIHIIHKHAALALSTESGGGGAPHHDRRLSCRATPASQSRGPVECPESSPAGLAASSQQRSRATAPVSIAHHRHHHRSLARVIARSKEPPAEPGRQSAVARRAPQPHPGGCWLVQGQRRTRGHTHSHSHQTTPQCALRPRRAAACRPPAARGEERNRCTSPSTPQNGNRSPWLCCLYS